MHLIIDCTTTQDQMAYAGVGQYTKNITLSLIKNYPSIKYSLLLFENKESTLDEGILKYPNIEIINVGKYRLNDYRNDITYFTQILPKILKIKQEDSKFFSPYFWRNFPSYSMPTILFVHDMNLPIFNMYSQQSPIHNLIRKIQYWLTLNKCKKCRHIICNSQTTKKDFLKYYPKYPEKNIKVSFLGVDIEEKEVMLEEVLPNDYEQRKYLMYLGGGINENKNSIGVIEGYIEFLKLLKTDYNKAPYLVISGGRFQDESQKEVQELYDVIERNNIQDNVIFTGFYEDDQKYSLLKNSFAFIHLSLYEGFGFSPIEALRSKIPTILHRSPVYEELFGSVGVMVDGENRQEVGKNIYEVYTHPNRYLKDIERGYRLSKKYTWENVADITYEVFKEV